MHLRVFHRLEISAGVFRAAAGRDTYVMQTGNAVIQRPGKNLVQIDAAIIHDVQLAAKQNLHAVQFARNAAAGTEIMLAGRTFHRRAVVGNAQQCKPLSAGGLRHLVNGVVGVAAGCRMGVNIQNIKHGAPSPPSVRDTTQSPDPACRSPPCRSRFPARFSSALCC